MALRNLGVPFISIHAPTRGATIIWYLGDPPLEFQSTLPREERRVIMTKSTGDGKISIHAPTRGATTFTENMVKGAKFQSTLPREERH